MNARELPTRPQIEIDLRKVRENFLSLVTRAGSSKITAVVKSDCYGMGIKEIVPELAKAGCDTFWIAHASEAKQLRNIVPNATIYALNGIGSDSIKEAMKMRVRPVISTIKQMLLWLQNAGDDAEPVALHVETGLNRLAIKERDIPEAVAAWKSGKLKISIIMSHLACADEPEHPMNRSQLDKFNEIKKMFPGVSTSIEASYGFFLPGDEFRHGLVRAGRALYGIKTPQGETSPVFRISAPVLQVSEIQPGETVGYTATWRAEKPSRIATISIGYADGMLRSLQQNGKIYLTHNEKTISAPIVGRISMDLICCDITGLPHSALNEGDMADLVTCEHYIDDLAGNAGTIGYEIMARLGARFERKYIK